MWRDKGACDDAQLGYLTQLLEKIKPAITLEKSFKENRNGSNLAYVNEVAKINIKNSIQNILNKSRIIKELTEQKTIKIIGGLYDIASGEVLFFDE